MFIQSSLSLYDLYIFFNVIHFVLASRGEAFTYQQTP